MMHTFKFIPRCPHLLTAFLLGLSLIWGFSVEQANLNRAMAQTGDRRPLTLQSDIQEANARTGVITARGNVQINYPARNIRATAAQALYYSRERRIVLSGNVYVTQDGNSLRGETITYLIDEGRFIALPQSNRQVESIYLVPDAPEEQSASPAPGNPPF